MTKCQITINGQAKTILSPMNLKQLIEDFSRNTKHLIAECNGMIIKKVQWEQHVVQNGDTIELVSLVGGG